MKYISYMKGSHYRMLVFGKLFAEWVVYVQKAKCLNINVLKIIWDKFHATECYPENFIGVAFTLSKCLH